tara:strand:- start:1542 stop:3011 length:1470 start_codon:yes stop_codon:yes gene_type:complete
MFKKSGLILGPVVFIITIFFFKPEGLSIEGNAILASTLWIAIWWISEAVPYAITSLLPIILFPLTGALGLVETSASYGHRYIFLYIGGFILAIAIERWGLHKRIALNTIKFIGTNIKSIILGFMVATAFLSMWISNTAASVMMLPIGMSIISQLVDNPNSIENENKVFAKKLMLSIAYSASIGGVATLIGTPPNLILAGIVEETYGIEITFSKWLMFGFPISLVLLFICWKYLTQFTFSIKQKSFPGGKFEIEKQIINLGKMSYEEKIILFIFILTALAWTLRSFLLENFIPNIDDTIIALISALILFIIPASKEKNRKLINWKEAVRLPWEILLLFGGGLAIAQGFTTSGLSNWIGSQLTLFEGASIFILLLFLIAIVNFLTEITSNLATTAMILPVLAPLALIIEVNPLILMVGATVAASCAFMLPVATPPNAVVFGSGHLTIPNMIKTGIWMNLLSIFLLTLIVYFFLPLIWDLELKAILDIKEIN